MEGSLSRQHCIPPGGWGWGRGGWYLVAYLRVFQRVSARTPTGKIMATIVSPFHLHPVWTVKQDLLPRYHIMTLEKQTVTRFSKTYPPERRHQRSWRPPTIRTNTDERAPAKRSFTLLLALCERHSRIPTELHLVVKGYSVWKFYSSFYHRSLQIKYKNIYG